MSEKSHPILENSFYYVALHASANRHIFTSPIEYLHFLSLLEKNITESKIQIHGFCLLQDEIHLLAKTNSTPINEALDELKEEFSHWSNLVQNKRSSLLKKSKTILLVDPKVYPAHILRYLHQLPVHHKLVAKSDIYPWSSHQSYVDQSIFPWLSCSEVLSQINHHRNNSQRRFEQFMDYYAHKVDSELLFNGDFIKDHIIGNQQFASSALGHAENTNNAPMSLSDIIDTVCQSYGISQTDLNSKRRIRVAPEARAMIGWLSQENSICSPDQVAESLNIDPVQLEAGMRNLTSTSSAQLRHLEEQLDFH